MPRSLTPVTAAAPVPDVVAGGGGSVKAINGEVVLEVVVEFVTFTVSQYMYSTITPTVERSLVEVVEKGGSA